MNSKVEQLNNEGVQSFLKGEFLTAEEKYAAALLEDPKYAATLNNFGILCLQKKEFVTAEKYFQKALKEKDHATYHLNLGHAYANQNKVIQAEEAYQKSLALDSKSFRAWRSLGALYQLQKKYQESISIWQQLLAMIPREPSITLALAKDFIKINQYENALILLERTTFPEQLKGEVWYYIACIQLHYQNFGMAEIAIKKSLVNSPNGKKYRALWATIALAQSKLNEALKQWNFILKIDENNHAIRIDKAVALWAHSHAKQALNEIEIVLKSEKNHSKALYYKALILLNTTEEHNEAYTLLKVVKESTSEYAEAAKEVLEKINDKN